MGVKQSILNGARAQLIVNGRIVGVFTTCSWGLAYDAAPAYILGAYAPVEITYTGQEPVSVTAAGFRVVENGAHVAAGVPKLQELMAHEDVTLSISDRQTGKTIMLVKGVRPLAYDTDVSARSISTFTVRFMGLKVEDESGAHAESPGASTLQVPNN